MSEDKARIGWGGCGCEALGCRIGRVLLDKQGAADQPPANEGEDA